MPALLIGQRQKTRNRMFGISSRVLSLEAEGLSMPNKIQRRDLPKVRLTHDWKKVLQGEADIAIVYG